MSGKGLLELPTVSADACRRASARFPRVFSDRVKQQKKKYGLLRRAGTQGSRRRPPISMRTTAEGLARCRSFPGDGEKEMPSPALIHLETCVSPPRLDLEISRLSCRRAHEWAAQKRGLVRRLPLIMGLSIWTGDRPSAERQPRPWRLPKPFVWALLEGNLDDLAYLHSKEQKPGFGRRRARWTSFATARRGQARQSLNSVQKKIQWGDNAARPSRFICCARSMVAENFPEQFRAVMDGS